MGKDSLAGLDPRKNLRESSAEKRRSEGGIDCTSVLTKREKFSEKRFGQRSTERKT